MSNEHEHPRGTEVVEPGERRPSEFEAREACREELRTRLILPILVPVLAVFAVLFFVINVSRVFLTSHTTAPAVIVATIVTLVILGGASALSGAPRTRSSPMWITVVIVGIVVLGAGVLVVGHSEEHKVAATGYQAPAGPPVAQLDVDALPTLKFQATDFTVPPGVLQIRYVDKGGTHTLVFDDPKYAGFELKVSGQGDDQGKVDLAPGNYVIYCSIPGHREAGMQATVHVVPGAPSPVPIGGP